MSKPLTISIDLDKTWTADPWFWNRFAYLCTADSFNHKLIMITRREIPTLPHELAAFKTEHQIPNSVTIYSAAYGFKRDAVPFPVDIWIDDEPGTIEPQRLLQEPSDSSL